MLTLKYCFSSSKFSLVWEKYLMFLIKTEQLTTMHQQNHKYKRLTLVTLFTEAVVES
jgi:hypothetical protein